MPRVGQLVRCHCPRECGVVGTVVALGSWFRDEPEARIDVIPLTPWVTYCRVRWLRLVPWGEGRRVRRC